MNESQELKLKELRTKYARSPESQQDIDQYEKDLTRLIEESRLVSNPIFQAIFKDAEKKLNEINSLLMNDESLTDLNRACLFHEKKVWLFNLSRFGLAPTNNAIKLLEETIDVKLRQ